MNDRIASPDLPDTLSEADLLALGTRAFQGLGLAAEDAADVARILVMADLFGLTTHGLSRVESYGERLDIGGIAKRPEIVVQRVAPALVTLGMFVFIYQWNEIIWTMTLTRASPDLQTVPVGIYLLRSAFDDVGQQGLQQAAIAVSTAPVLVLFLLLQRFYLRGAVSSGLTG